MKFLKWLKSRDRIVWDMIMGTIIVIIPSVLYGAETGLLLCAVVGLFKWRVEIKTNRTLDAIDVAKKTCLEYQEALETVINNFSGFVMPAKKMDSIKYVMLNAKLNMKCTAMISELKLINKLTSKKANISKIKRMHKRVYESSLHIVDRTSNGFPISGLELHLFDKMLQEIESIIDALNMELCVTIS